MSHRIAVLVSGQGTNLQAVLDACQTGRLEAEVCVVVANRAEAPALNRAQAAGVPCELVLASSHPTREAYDAALLAVLERYHPDFVLLAGFMRVVGPEVVRRFQNRILNVHPALLPAFPGLHAVRQALAHGVKVTGCTVHLVDTGVDTGPILLQRAVPVRDDDSEQTLTARIQHEEHILVVDALRQLVAGRAPA